MAKIQFLTILLVFTCFLCGVVSVTDKEFKDLSDHVKQLAEISKGQLVINQHLKSENEALSKEVQELKMALGRQGLFTGQIKDDVISDKELLDFLHPGRHCKLEERVSVLEVQVMDLDKDVDFLFDDQLIQDERLFSLEQGINVIESEIDVMDEEVEELQETTFALDFRMAALEENLGDDELVDRVESLEETAADHETRVRVLEADVSDLGGTTAEQETRLTAAEENILGLQMEDVDLDARVTALEENGEGNGQNDTIAFHTALTSYSTIPYESAVLFNEVLLNEGHGYNSTTGTFTVPSGGDGFYYFSAYARVYGGEFAIFDIEINGERVCSVTADVRASDFNDREITACSGAVYAVEGDTVQVVYKSGQDSTPLIANAFSFYNGFTGFRI